MIELRQADSNDGTHAMHDSVLDIHWGPGQPQGFRVLGRTAIGKAHDLTSSSFVYHIAKVCFCGEAGACVMTACMVAKFMAMAAAVCHVVVVIAACLCKSAS